MTQRRLGPVDAAFLHVEDRSNRMQLAGVLIFDGDAPPFAEFRDAIARCLPLLPRFRQRLQHSSLRLNRPTWVDDDAFDLDYHLHRLALPAPGRHAEIVGLIDHITAQPLDMQRPLWELALVEGLGGRFAVSIKVHHSMVDGLSIIDIFAVLCNPDPQHQLPDPREWKPQPPPSWWHRVRPPDLPRKSGKILVACKTTDAESWKFVRRLQRARRLIGRAPETRFNSGAPSPVRRSEFLTIPLDTIHDIRYAHRTTVNNVVLAIVAGALHRYLVRHDELVDHLHAFVPVNRRPQDQRGELGNQIAMTYPSLPVGEPDPASRLAGVITAVESASAAKEADDTAALMNLTKYAPQPIVAALNRAMHFDTNMFNLTVTNVAGPHIPVYFLGRQLQLILGATPLTRRHALTVAVLSYRGQLTFSVTTDPRRVPDLAALIDDITAEIDALHALASRSGDTSSATSTTRRDL